MVETMRRRSAGFTLLELMVVVTIMGILVSIAIPGFGYLAANTKVKGASTELYLGLIRARSESVKRNRPVGLIRNAGGWQAGWQVIADGNNDGDFGDVGAAPPDNDILVFQQGDLRRVAITATNASVCAPSGTANCVLFRPTGRIFGAAPSFTVTSEDQDRKVDLNRCVSADLTGRPYVKPEACV